MIKDEADVRSWVRQASAGKARWVEPSMGSTLGLPDCWVPISYDVVGIVKEAQVHLELKVGEIKGNHLCFTVRPEQRREIKSMIGDGVPVGMIIGIVGTDFAVFALPTRHVLNGKMSMVGGEAAANTMNISTQNDSRFYDGVFFIFSGNRRMAGYRATVGRVWGAQS
jgi:hypothetical protein